MHLCLTDLEMTARDCFVDSVLGGNLVHCRRLSLSLQAGLASLVDYGSDSSSSSSSSSSNSSGSSGSAGAAKRRRGGAADAPPAAKLGSVSELFSSVQTKILSDHSRKLADVAAAAHVPKSSWSTGVKDASVRKEFVTVVPWLFRVRLFLGRALAFCSNKACWCGILVQTQF